MNRPRRVRPEQMSYKRNKSEFVVHQMQRTCKMAVEHCKAADLPTPFRFRTNLCDEGTWYRVSNENNLDLTVGLQCFREKHFHLGYCNLPIGMRKL